MRSAGFRGNVRSRLWLLGCAFLVAAAALLFDQGAKWLIVQELTRPPREFPLLPFLSLRLGFNTGVSFGMLGETFGEAPYALAGLAGVVVGFLWLLVWRSRSALEAAALGLVIGGASGNILDRLRLGAVVDFIDLHYAGWSWPTFNTADMAIITGVTLVLISPAIERRRMAPADHRNRRPTAGGRPSAKEET